MSLGNIPDGLNHLKHSALNKVDQAMSNIVRYTNGGLAEKRDGKMRLYPPPPFARITGESLSQAKKIANAVYGLVGAPVVAVVYAPMACYKNRLLDKKKQLEQKLNDPSLKVRSKEEKDNISAVRAKIAKYDPEHAKSLEKFDENLLKDQLARVENKLGKVDQNIHKMTTTAATKKHDLKSLNVAFEREREILKDMQKEKVNNEIYLKSLPPPPADDPDLHKETREEIKAHVEELTKKIAAKEEEVKQLKGEMAKLDKGLRDIFKDEFDSSEEI